MKISMADGCTPELLRCAAQVLNRQDGGAVTSRIRRKPEVSRTAHTPTRRTLRTTGPS